VRNKLLLLKELILLLFFLKLMTNSLYDNMCVKMDYRYIRAERESRFSQLFYFNQEKEEKKTASSIIEYAMRLTIIIHIYIYIDNKGREREKKKT